MIQTRHNIFETNSSSTHSICFSFKKLKIHNYELSILGNTCYIEAVDQMEDFYDDQYQVMGEKNKLNYIFTWMYIRDSGLVLTDEPNIPLYWPEPCQLDTGIFESQYWNVLNAIKRKYPEVERIYFNNPKKAEFDHQTGPWEEGPIVDLDSEDDIYEFLFNSHFYIQIGHD